MINLSKVKNLNDINVKIVKKVIQVFYFILIGGGILFFLLFIATLFIPKDVLTLSGDIIPHIKFEIGNMFTYQIRDLEIDSISLKGILLTITISAAICIGLVVLILHQLIKIFDTLEVKNPFDEKNSTRILNIGGLLIISSFVVNGLMSLVYYMMIKELNINFIDIDFSINVGLLFSGILVVILSSIFKYGTFLQNEYDQTL